MSTPNIVNERSRRTSIAALLLEREDFDPTYEDDNAVDPQNLPDNILAIYNTLVDSNLQVVDPNASIFGDARGHPFFDAPPNRRVPGVPQHQGNAK